jgi:2-oxoglutarate ferredoxin oxidoreductase subunit gamma
MMGYSLAHAAMNQGLYVTCLPSYGAEMRGGTANCTVAVGDEEIASPIASEPDNLVALNAPSLLAFQNKLACGGTVFINSSIVKAGLSRGDVEAVQVPCVGMAEEAGNPKAANMVMMGAFLAVTGLVKPETYLKSVETIMGSKKKSHMESNRRAFEAGFRLASAPGGGGAR